VLVISFFISSLAAHLFFEHKSLLLIEYNQEIEKIKRNYDSLLQNEDFTYLQTERERTDLYRKVFLNKALAEYFRGLFTLFFQLECLRWINLTIAAILVIATFVKWWTLTIYCPGKTD
jgi:hypothetical protein